MLSTVIVYKSDDKCINNLPFLSFVLWKLYIFCSLHEARAIIPCLLLLETSLCCRYIIYNADTHLEEIENFDNLVVFYSHVTFFDSAMYWRDCELDIVLVSYVSLVLLIQTWKKAFKPQTSVSKTFSTLCCLFWGHLNCPSKEGHMIVFFFLFV